MIERTYEQFPIGTHIRAWDFEKIEGRKDSYAEGIVISHEEVHGAYMLKVHVTADSVFDLGARLQIHVPLMTSMFDHADRIEVLKETFLSAEQQQQLAENV